MKRTIVVLIAGFLLAVAGPAKALGDVLVIPVAFGVRNVNGSAVSCPTDGEPYTVRGHLVAPRSALVTPDPAVTLYVHGAFLGEPIWRQTVLPGYDFPVEMARLGHASVTISRLGFRQSDIPNGNLTCLGSDADMTVQIMRRLRTGDYDFVSAVPGILTPPAFGRVALAGNSGGGAVTRIAAYSFADTGEIDALVQIDTFRFKEGEPEFGFANSTDPLPPFLTTCAAGGESKDGGGAGAGYVLAPVRENAEFYFHDAEPAIVQSVLDAGEREPCGGWNSLPAAALQDEQRMGEINVPVLYIHGSKSAVWQPGAFEREKATLTGSPEVAEIEIAGAGHIMFLERTAPSFRTNLSGWLSSHGF